MNTALLWSIAATGFSVAFVHAALPTHWLPFVLAGRAQRWDAAKTLTVTGLAGGGHVLFTVALGLIVAGLGFAVDRWTGGVFPWIAGILLIAFGVFYLRGGGHGHLHFGHDPHHHDHPHEHAHGATPAVRRDRTVILGLVAALTFSPCEGFLPVFVAGARYGWAGFALLSAILALATLGSMLLFTWFMLHGLSRMNSPALERVEGRVLGVLLCGLGLAVLLLET